MIATGTIESILYKRIKANPIFGVFPEIEKGDLTPVTEENNHDRISIGCNASSNEDWQRSFAYVYIYVPDTKVKGVYRKNDAKLIQYELEARKMFSQITMLEIDDGKLWYWASEGNGFKKEKESETWSHVITVKLRVKNSNFKF